VRIENLSEKERETIMGQYYMAYVKGDEGERVFCPQNAVYMTKNGIKDSSKIGNRSWYSNSSGLKLMEHSWIENDFVNGVLEAIWDKPARVAWVGDYADDEYDFDGYYTKAVYDAVWGEEKEPEQPFDEVPTVHKSGFIVNHDKGVYIDLDRYVQASGFEPTWSKGNIWTIHPLPILTSIGNGRGGGDYHGVNMGTVGTWAMDKLSYTQEKPKLMEEVLIPFIED
jgi:hypothetical protein